MRFGQKITNFWNFGKPLFYPLDVQLFNKHTRFCNKLIFSNRVKGNVHPINSVTSHCARGKSSIARKLEVNPKTVDGKKLFTNVTLQILNFILVI